MHEFDKTFEGLMREMVSDAGSKLLEEEKIWRGRVPASMDKAARSALKKGLASAAAVSAAAGAAHLVKVAAAVLAAALVLTAGTVAAVPALREKAAALFSGTRQAVSVSAQQNREPGDYLIPLPDESFSVTDAAENARLVYKWFTSGQREFLVEIACTLPQNFSAGETEYVTVADRLLGAYSESGAQKLLLLQDGDVSIQLVSFNATREELLDYAARLVLANGITVAE